MTPRPWSPTPSLPPGPECELVPSLWVLSSACVCPEAKVTSMAEDARGKAESTSWYVGAWEGPPYSF